jgi:branched-chain amino acid transport system ATP-binding protein
MGLFPTSSGDIRFAGEPITRASTAMIVGGGIAEVPERRQLFGTMTVEENLRLGAYTCKDHETVARLLAEQFELFPILSERRRQLAETLSGGEQQMVALARAMMASPKLMLLDEPSLGLAPLMVERIFGQITNLRAAGRTVLVVEQNARAALAIADRGYVLENGRIVNEGPAAALLADKSVQEAYLGGSSAGVRDMEVRIRERRRQILAQAGRAIC